jgi:nitrogen fixation NifU-like protein
MYSERLLALFHSRAHAGNLEGATHCSEAGTPGAGPYMRLWLQVEDGIVVAARYKTYGCPAAIACAEAVCAWSEGRPIAVCVQVTAEAVREWAGGVPEGKEHCPELAAVALRGATSNQLMQA